MISTTVGPLTRRSFKQVTLTPQTPALHLENLLIVERGGLTDVWASTVEKVPSYDCCLCQAQGLHWCFCQNNALLLSTHADFDNAIAWINEGRK